MEEVKKEVVIQNETQNISEEIPSPQNETASEPSTPQTRIKPKFFFDPDELIKVQVSAFYNPETGRLEFCVPGKIKDSGNDLVLLVHEFEFDQIPYDRMNLYRMQSTVYNSEDHTNSINIIRLRNYFWTFHLKNWNYTDNDDKPIPLTRDPNGALSDESLKLLYKIPTSILDMAVGIFEKQINLA